VPLASIGSTAITVVVVAFICLLVLSRMVNSLSKSGQKLRGRNRCEGCGSRLKAQNGRYMPVCRRCGTKQTWAA
jgi:hypothetical protein